MKMKLLGGLLAATTATALGVAILPTISIQAQVLGAVNSAEIITETFYGRVVIEDEVQYIKYDSSKDSTKLVHADSQNEGAFNIILNKNNDIIEATLSYGDKTLGYNSGTNLKIDSTYKWIVKEGRLWTRDENRCLLYNPTTNKVGPYAKSNIDTYLDFYFYTEDELEKISFDCQSIWANTDREEELTALALDIKEPGPVVKYNLTLDANGGEGTKIIQVKAGSYDLPDGSDFTKTGYDFDGWSYTANGPKITDESIVITADIILYVVWKEYVEPVENWLAATMSAGTNGSICTVNNKNGIKVGTSKAGGNMTITIPQGAVKLRFYAAAWNGVTELSLNVSGGTVDLTSIPLTADTGIANNSPFTLAGNEADYLQTITLSNINQETTLTFASSTSKRFVVWSAEYTK